MFTPISLVSRYNITLYPGYILPHWTCCCYTIPIPYRNFFTTTVLSQVSKFSFHGVGYEFLLCGNSYFKWYPVSGPLSTGENISASLQNIISIFGSIFIFFSGG